MKTKGMLAIFMWLYLLARPIYSQANIGQELQNQIVKRFGRISFENQEAYILSRVGKTTEKYFSQTFRYGIIASREVESFGLPGGTVLLSQSMVEVANGSEAEIGAVLAIEQASSGFDLGIKDALRQVIVETGIELIFKKAIPQKINIPQLDKNVISQGLADFLTKGRQSNDQLRADTEAVNALCQSDQNPENILRFLMKLEALENCATTPRFVSSNLATRFSQNLISHYRQTHNSNTKRVDNCVLAILKDKYQTDFTQPTQSSQLVDTKSNPNQLANGFSSPTGAPPIIICDFLEPGKPFGTYFTGQYHLGEDLALRLGDAVYSIDKGEIVLCSKNGWGEGNCALVIQHQTKDGSDYKVYYGHLVLATAKKIGKVKSGEKIGEIGVWDPPHLHLGVNAENSIPQYFGLGYLPGEYKKGDTLEDYGFIAPSTFLARHSAQVSQAIAEAITLQEKEIHLGDDTSDARIFWDSRFQAKQSGSQSALTFELRAVPKKDPIFFINHHEICRIIPETSEWQEYRYSFDSSILQTDNIFYIKSFIPNVRQGFDDSLVRNIKIEFGS